MRDATGRLCMVIAATTVLSSAPWLSAQPSEPVAPEKDAVSEDAEAEAKRLYGEADAHYAAGRYDKAIESFRKAYELSNKAALLFNIANAYERNGDYQEAADYLSRYAESSVATDISSIKERIKRLETNAAEKLQREIDEKNRAKEKDEAPPVVNTTPTGPKRPIIEPARSGETRSRTSAWVLLGVGAAIVTGGVVTGVVSRSIGNDARDLCSGDNVCPDDASSDLDRERNLGIAADITMGVGVLTAGVGLYLLLRADRGNDSKALAFTPSSDGASVSYVGRF